MNVTVDYVKIYACSSFSAHQRRKANSKLTNLLDL